MKLATVILFATGALAAQKVHRHRHRHAPAQLEVRDVTTVIVYVLNGKVISEADCLEGINNGTLVWGDDGAPVIVSSATPTPTPTPTPSPSSAELKVAQVSQYTPPASSAAASSAAASGGGLDTPFPTGLPCDKFPTGYGAIANDYLNLGGWIGIQLPGYSGSNGFDKIMSPKKNDGTCNGGSCVKDGAWLSYNCPPGYSKSSWPAIQGVTGQSVGGLKCVNGALEMGDGSVAKTLCVAGSDKAKVTVVNKMDKCSSVCKTDYPGTEGETAGVYVAPGGSEQLFCPDSASYYQHDGKGTSSQYYINPKGYEPKDACWWGNPGEPLGNNAPMNIGVGVSDGKAWISLFQNLPTNSKDFLDYTVEIKGDNVVGTCKYSNGQYCGDTGCNTGAGCTVAGTGDIQIVLTD